MSVDCGLLEMLVCRLTSISNYCMIRRHAVLQVLVFSKCD